jgi:hypothetical protein
MTFWGIGDFRGPINHQGFFEQNSSIWHIVWRAPERRPNGGTFNTTHDTIKKTMFFRLLLKRFSMPSETKQMLKELSEKLSS